MTSDNRASPLWPAMVAAVLLAAAVLSIGCADFSRGSASPAADAGMPDGGSANPDGARSFAGDVHDLLTSGCRDCHQVGAEAGDTGFLLTDDAATDYAVVTPFVNTAAPADSRLLAKMAGRGHGGGSVYAAGTPEYQAVLMWIQEGARP